MLLGAGDAEQRVTLQLGILHFISATLLPIQLLVNGRRGPSSKWYIEFKRLLSAGSEGCDKVTRYLAATEYSAY